MRGARGSVRDRRPNAPRPPSSYSRSSSQSNILAMPTASTPLWRWRDAASSPLDREIHPAKRVDLRLSQIVGFDDSLDSDNGHEPSSCSCISTQAV